MLQQHVQNTVAAPKMGQVLISAWGFQGSFTRKVTFEEWVGFVSLLSGEKITRIEAGKLRKYLAGG